MPTISIRDGLNADIVSASPHISTGFGKYLKGQSAALLAATDVVGQLRTPLHLANIGESGLGLVWGGDVALGKNRPALTIEAGATATIGVLNRAGMEIFDTTFVGAPMKVASGSALVSFAIRPSLALGLKRETGALSFGFDAGGQAELSYFHPFDLTGVPMSVADACKAVFEHFVVPNTVDDLRAMRDLPPTAVACVSGHGQLMVSASVDVAAAFNPLASVDNIPRLGTLNVGGGASATVGVKAMVSGDFQIRVQKMVGARVRVGYHKVAGRALEVSLNGSLGLGVSLGDKDLLGLLFKAPGGMPGATREDLVQGGITSKQLDRVEAAMKAGLSRKVELAVAASFSSSTTNEAAFLYEIDLDALDAEGEAALGSALAGDLSLLNAIEGDAPAHGIHTLASRMRTIRKKKVAWRINVVGIINVLSMRELVKAGSIAHDHESGELVVLDKITSDHVGAITSGKHIRKLLYESTLMSLTYRAAGFDATEGLTIDQSFFIFDRSANRQRVSDYLDAVRALGLVADDSDGRLGAEDDFGSASLLLETSYDRDASERMFEAASGTPDSDFYETIGRRALLALIKPNEPDAYRRLPLFDNSLWKKMRETGQPGFRFVLPPPITGGGSEAVRVGVVEADYSVIVWWAGAMAKAAERLADMHAFLANRDPLALDQDPAFDAQRSQLANAMVKVIRSNKSTFDDPWAMVALHHAAGGATSAAATLVSPKLTLFLPE